MRAFIGTDFSETVRAEIMAVQARLEPLAQSGRWQAESDLHLTLKFLGEISPAQLEALDTALQTVAGNQQPFDLVLSDLWTYMDGDLVRFLWLGLSGDLERLRSLQTALDQALEPLGFPAEKRGFAPHITLGQDLTFQTDFPSVRTAVGPVRIPGLVINRLALFASEGMQGHRSYRKVADYPLRQRY